MEWITRVSALPERAAYWRKEQQSERNKSRKPRSSYPKNTQQLIPLTNMEQYKLRQSIDVSTLNELMLGDRVIRSVLCLPLPPFPGGFFFPHTLPGKAPKLENAPPTALLDFAELKQLSAS